MSNSKQHQLAILVLVIALASAIAAAEDRPSVVAPDARLTKIEGRFDFTEGPVTDVKGNVYFSDVRASRTYRWSADGKVETWREDTGNANGLALDKAGNLLACEGARGRVVSIDPQGKVSIAKRIATPRNMLNFIAPNSAPPSPAPSTTIILPQWRQL